MMMAEGDPHYALERPARTHRLLALHQPQAVAIAIVVASLVDPLRHVPPVSRLLPEHLSRHKEELWPKMV